MTVNSEEQTANGRRVLLLGVDLEDVRSMIPDGDRYRERVPDNTQRLLEFLEQRRARCTFFTVGDVARRYPDLIREILARGHEVACHSSDHTPLPSHDRESFRRDVEANLRDLAAAGAADVRGFRAPILSMTPRSSWAHEVLAELGLSYSSSILPVRGPSYSWPGFGARPRRMPSGLWEIPVSPGGILGFGVAFVGGLYLRVLPAWIIRFLFERRLSEGLPVVGYVHPFDIDTEQERFVHPLCNSRLSHALMFWNRGALLQRLDSLLARNVDAIPYAQYTERMEATAAR